MMRALTICCLMTIGLLAGCNGHPKGEAVLSERRLRGPTDKYLSVMGDSGELAFVDATCRVHPGEALLKKSVLPCIRESSECDSVAQKSVNLRLWAKRLVKDSTGKTAEELCPDINKNLRGG